MTPPCLQGAVRSFGAGCSDAGSLMFWWRLGRFCRLVSRRRELSTLTAAVTCSYRGWSR